MHVLVSPANVWHALQGSLKDLEHAGVQIEVVKLLLALPVEFWDTAEEAVAEADVATSASPLPDNRKVWNATYRRGAMLCILVVEC